MNPLSWTRLAAAMEFYSGYGFKYVDVPWIVDHAAMFTTPPERGVYAECIGSSHTPTDGYLIGSGEQGFIDLIQAGVTPPTLAMTCTPCFRDEESHDDITRPYFMKVELASFDPLKGHIWMAEIARKFMMRFGRAIMQVSTDIGVDLQMGGVEVGSYGNRLVPDWGEFSYGTGLAEPRFTALLNR